MGGPRGPALAQGQRRVGGSARPPGPGPGPLGPWDPRSMLGAWCCHGFSMSMLCLFDGLHVWNMFGMFGACFCMFGASLEHAGCMGLAGFCMFVEGVLFMRISCFCYNVLLLETIKMQCKKVNELNINTFSFKIFRAAKFGSHLHIGSPWVAPFKDKQVNIHIQNIVKVI